jgi:GGDEF domain-containing protein
MRNTKPASVGSGFFPKKIVFRFLRLNIAKKMLLGYLTLVALIFVISAFAISSLEKLNNINEVIVRTDVPLIETADRMIDTIISQELYARRYAILNSSEMLILSREKSKEFDSLVEKVRSLPGIKDVPVDRIVTLHSEYNKLLLEGIKYFRDPSSPSAKKNDSVIKKNLEELIGLIRDSSSSARQDQKEKIVMTSHIGIIAIRITVILCFISILLSILLTMLITGSIAVPISQLKLATQKISEGKFDLVQEVKNQDELGELANAFNEMTKRLKHLEDMYLDANPLTRLPGNIAIENVLKKRLETGNPLAFCYVDLDDFKAFNDRYGYAKGSEVIMATAKIIEKCVTEAGTPDDFVGHIGGDDFVVITTPDHFKKTCDCIINTFDVTIPNFYDRRDLNKGFIIGKTRQGEELKFPIMSLSIAVVTNLERRLTSSLQVGEIAAELKEYVKSIPGSVYVVDRRRKTSGEENDETIIQIASKESIEKDA